METTATKLKRITTKAKREPGYRFTYVKYLLNEEYLYGCFTELKRKKAAGVDGRTVESYTEEAIRVEIHKVVEQMKHDQYNPQPVRRVWIPKGKGSKRALGIPTVLDKVIQLGCAKILAAIWENKFLAVSYGYRPGRDAHECIKEVNHMLMGKPVHYVLEADIEGFFNHVDHTWMRRCMEQHIGDPRFTNLIMQMLKAGVMEEGIVHENREGTAQGGIISPILANMYLHYVLDLWFERQEKRKIQGYTQLVRYADDFIIGCQNKWEAERIQKDLQERLGKFGLRLATEKTRITRFNRIQQQQGRITEKPETFDFLGFTQHRGKTRDGRYVVKVRTSRERMKQAQQKMNTYLRKTRSAMPIQALMQNVAMKLRGHYQYYGVSGNFAAIQRFYRKTRRMLYKWLNRRSQKQSYNWEQFARYVQRYPLPQPRLYYAFYNTF